MFSLEWVSSTSYKPKYGYSNFGVDDSIQHDSQRCTFALFSNNLPADYGHEGKWYKEKCEKTKGSKIYFYFWNKHLNSKKFVDV
jgi:hypothetical protein